MATDIAKIGIEVQVDGAPAAANRLRAVDSEISSGKKATDELNKSLSNTNKRVDELADKLARAEQSRAFSGMDRDASRLGGTIGALVKRFALLAATLASVVTAGALISSGLDYNRQLEDAQIGISTVIALNNNIIDSQGRMLQGQEKFNTAQQLSVDIVKALDGATAAASADFSDLLRAFQSTLGPAQALGLTWKDNIQLVTLMSNAMKAMNIDMERLDSEALAFLTGKNLNNSQVRLNLGLDEKTIKGWGKGEQYIKNLVKALEQAKYAGEAAQNTFSVSTAAARENLQSLSAEMTKPLFDKLSESAGTFANALFEIDNATGTWAVKENIQPLVDLGRDAAEALGNGVVSAVTGLVSKLETLGRVVRDNREDVQGFFEGLSIALQSIGEASFTKAEGFITWVKEQMQSLPGYSPNFVPADMDMTGLANNLPTSGKDFRDKVEAFYSPDAASVRGTLDAIEMTRSGLEALTEEAKEAGVQLAPITSGRGTSSGNKTASALEKQANLLERLAAKSKELQARVDEDKQSAVIAQWADDLAKFTREAEKLKGASKEQALAYIESIRASVETLSAREGDKQRAEDMRLMLDFQEQYARVMRNNAAAEQLAIQKQAAEWRKMAMQISDVAEREKVLTQVVEMEAQLRLDASRSWTSGAKRAADDYATEALNAGKNTATAVSSMFSSMEDALTSFVTTGKLEVSDLVNSIVADFARLAIRQAITGPLASGFSSLLSAIFPSAKGNVFDNAPGLSAYSSTVVDRPVFFPFARGIGMMGEAGPEAIMPLGRDAQGRLGVRTADGAMQGGGMPPIHLEPHVHLYAQGGTAEQNQDLVAQAMKGMERTLRSLVRSELMSQFRSGGAFAPAWGMG